MSESLQRINIVGCSGSGKTTLGHALAQKLGVAATDLDDLHWLPGWIGRPKPEFDALLHPILQSEKWIITGNYSRVQPRIWSRADTVIWLDYSRPIVMNQVIKRTFRRNLSGELCCNGNRESLKSTFSRQSIILYAWQMHERVRRKYPALLAHPDQMHLQILRFTSPHQTRLWLSQL